MLTSKSYGPPWELPHQAHPSLDVTCASECWALNLAQSAFVRASGCCSPAEGGPPQPVPYPRTHECM